MTTKKKLAISISTLCVAILAVVGISVGVWAARNASINNPINVGYTSHEVAATVTATYQRETDEAPTAFQTEEGETSITFTGEETEGDATAAFAAVDASNLELSSTNRYIVFTYTFQNNGDADFIATMTLPETQTNVALSYELNSSSTESLSFTVSGNGSATFEVTVAIDDIAKDASFSGNISWTLQNSAEE